MKPILLTEKYKYALELVAVLFKDIERKVTGVPYIVHLVGVAHIVSSLTDDNDAVVAALLHDVLEDIPEQLYSESDMKKDFGEKITDIVKTVTHDEDKHGYVPARDKYLEQIKNGSKLAVIISAADLLYNICDSIDTYKKFPEKSKNLFVGGKSTARNRFYDKRYKIIASTLGSESPIVKELNESMKQFQAIRATLLLK